MLTTVFAVCVALVDLTVLCVAIARPHRTPASRVAWVAVILLLPLAGIAAYLLLGETSIGRKRLHRMSEAKRVLPLPEADPLPVELPAASRSAFELVRSINHFGPTAGNTVTLAPTAEAVMAELEADIDGASETVHISFYIWLSDHSGKRIADAVSRAARRGVTCRIMVDALGSRKFVGSPLWLQMRDAGAQVVAAMDELPRAGHLTFGRLDLRNHCKIVVVDDRVAYCGSRNCADPEFAPKARFGPWVDVFFRLQGPVVAQEQWLFASNWMVETGERIDLPPRAASDPAGEPGAGAIAAVFGTGPSGQGVMSAAFVSTISAASESVVITTPYFAPDAPLLQAICSAPRRGVETTLILPARNDSRLTAATARSHYEELLQAGVRLYEYPLGLLHSKTLVVDGHLSLVGSANMDRRSLELDDENNLLVDSVEVTAALAVRQAEYLAASTEIGLAEVEAWPFWRRLANNATAMLSPLL